MSVRIGIVKEDEDVWSLVNPVGSLGYDCVIEVEESQLARWRDVLAAFTAVQREIEEASGLDGRSPGEPC